MRNRRIPEAAKPGRRRVTVGATMLIAGLAAAACGSSTATSSNATSNTAATPSASTSGGSSTATVQVAKVTPVGTVLVASSGRSLYLFTPDQQKAMTCTGGCASLWTPLPASGTPAAGTGVTSSLLGTIKDPDGKTQVTYNHWPLYTYNGDSGAGQARGEGVGGVWFAVDASGKAVHAAAGSSPTTMGGSPTTKAKSGGYGY